MNQWLTRGDSRTLRQLAVQQDRADEEVEGTEDGISTDVTNMLLVLKAKNDKDRPSKRRLSVGIHAGSSRALPKVR